MPLYRFVEREAGFIHGTEEFGVARWYAPSPKVVIIPIGPAICEPRADFLLDLESNLSADHGDVHPGGLQERHRPVSEHVPYA